MSIETCKITLRTLHEMAADIDPSKVIDYDLAWEVSDLTVREYVTGL